MGYELHFEREPVITLEEWKAGVSGVAHVRLNADGASATNPKTGEVISIGGVDGDAEIEVGNRWQPFFRWRDRGWITFGYVDDFDNPDSRVRQLIARLSGLLEAKVVDDEGEVHNVAS